MKTIEEWIRQANPFRTKQERALVNLLFTGHHIFHGLDQFLKKWDLSQKQYNVLRILKGAESRVSIAYIKERLLVKNADVSRLVDRLDRKGLITKVADPDDKRLIRIGVSPTGNQLLQNIDVPLKKYIQQVICLNDEECTHLNQLLNKLKTVF